MNLRALILIAVWVCGCYVIRPIGSLDSSQISDKAEVAHSSSRQTTVVEGVKLVFGEFNENHYLLNATRTNGAAAVQYSFSMRTLRKLSLGGIGWKAAKDSEGRPLALVSAKVETNEDLLYESVSFELTREWLDRATTKEISVQITGEIRDQTVVFPTNYVSGFLDRVDREFHRRD